MKTEYLQGEEAREFMETWYCESCLSPAKSWAERDRYGNLEVSGMYDERGDLIGFLCPVCAKLYVQS